MIDGEIYVKNECDCIFAWRCTSGFEDTIVGEQMREIYHYVCINTHGEIHALGDGRTVGCVGEGTCRRATGGEIIDFINKLHAANRHYNKANRKVINMITGEVYG